MEYKDYIKLIGTPNIKSVCLLVGDEEYVKASVVERLKKAYVDPTMSDFDISVFDNQTTNYDEILPFVSSPAFVSEKKLAILNIKSDNPIFKDERFVKLCESVDLSVMIVIIVSGKVDKRLAGVKKIESVADVVSFDKLDNADIIKWIVRTFKENGKKITPSDAQYIVSVSGDELYFLQNEIGKIAASTDEDVITREDIDKMTVHTPEHGVFLLVDAVAAKNTKEAVRQCKLLMDDGAEPFQLLALVERQLQLIMRYISMNTKSVPQREIMDKLALKPFIFDKIKKQASNFSLEACKKALTMCLDLDNSIKSGKCDAQTGFEVLIARLSGAK